MFRSANCRGGRSITDTAVDTFDRHVAAGDDAVGPDLAGDRAVLRPEPGCDAAIVDAGPAESVDRPVPPDQCDRLAIADHGVAVEAPDGSGAYIIREF
jgi:hypothetical protein